MQKLKLHKFLSRLIDNVIFSSDTIIVTKERGGGISWKTERIRESQRVAELFCTKAPKGHGDFQKKAISKSLYRIVQSVLTD